ncbi:aldo/keto reductase [Oceanobacillus halophilus]|uniref:Aldo/keto reductase family oxidoreductase n=1 Tax=Oceanobacillus halophilus TaxID=930130 RepID=A0A495A6C0_9BACI|nr:aldo/keto reductase [Oceanobacillus halophilus]RKQ33901.1 aldo/keto reductase family oxidoreductase [Oceanobacillus halophilus]
MKKIKLGTSDLEVSNIALGCMSMGNKTTEEASKVLHNALELGIDFFDHADIYASGKSEEIFSEVLTPSTRDKITIQTKTGIRKGFFDFSKEHIINSVEGSLKRLKTDYIDILLLHRPDALVEPEEVAEAFSELHKSGKVRHFGVSNHNPMQIELLKKYVEQELIVNQLQLSVMHTGMIDAGLQVNTKHENGVNRDGSVLDYSRLNNMTIQAWSPFRYGNFEGLFIDNDEFPEVNSKLEEIGDKYHINKSAAAIAWILRHPAKIQAIVGTMTPERLTNIAKASAVELTREEWYELYRAAGNELP